MLLLQIQKNIAQNSLQLMRPFIIISLFYFLSIVNVKGQDSASLRVHLQGYNLVFPGVEIAYQYPILKGSFNEDKPNTLILNLAPVIDFYAYKGNHFGVGLTGELNIQQLFSKGMIFEIYGGYGILDAILSGTTYELNEVGEFETRKNKGNLYLNWKAGLGLSKIVALKSGKTICFNLRAGVRQAKTPGAFSVPNISMGANFLLSKTKE